MGATPGLRQKPTRARASSEGAVFSLPGRDGSNAASEPPRLRPGRKKPSKRAPPTPHTHPATLESLRTVVPLVARPPAPDFGDQSSPGTPGPSFAPPSLVFSVRKGDIGAVTERLRVGAACGHHISAGNGGGRETSVDPPALVSASLPGGTPD